EVFDGKRLGFEVTAIDLVDTFRTAEGLIKIGILDHVSYVIDRIPLGSIQSVIHVPDPLILTVGYFVALGRVDLNRDHIRIQGIPLDDRLTPVIVSDVNGIGRRVRRSVSVSVDVFPPQTIECILPLIRNGRSGTSNRILYIREWIRK